MKFLKYLMFGVVFVMIFTFYNRIGNNVLKTSTMPKTYLQHFDGSKSRLQTQCKIDKHCIIPSKLVSACGSAYSITKKYFTIKNLNIFNKKEKLLLEGVNIDCMTPLAKESIKPICKKNICSIKEK